MRSWAAIVVLGVWNLGLPAPAMGHAECAEDLPVMEQFACARSLAWAGNSQAALAHYDRLLALSEGAERREILLARSQLLEWTGPLDEALAVYELLVAQNPQDVEARVGMARVQRQRGRPLVARALLFELVNEGVTHPAMCQELAWTYVATKQPTRAEYWLSCAEPSATDALTERIDDLRRPELSLYNILMDDSFGMTRAAPRGIARFSVGHDLKLSVGAGLTYAVLYSEALLYDVAGAGLDYKVGRFDFQVAAGGMFQAESPHVLADISGTVGLRPFDQLRVRVNVRHRPFLETAPLLATPEEGYFGAGIAGATRLGHVTHLQVRQAQLGLDWAPFPGAYVYASGTHLQISDGNVGSTLAAGAGWNLLATLLSPTFPLELAATWNTYMAGYSDSPPDYFSPDLFEIHDVGGELRWRAFAGFEAFGSGAATFQATQPTGLGHMIGFGARWRNDWLELAIRAMTRDDLVYQQRRLLASLQARF